MDQALVWWWNPQIFCRTPQHKLSLFKLKEGFILSPLRFLSQCQTTVLREGLFFLQKPRINVGQTLAAQPQIFLSFFTLFIFCREVTRLNPSVLGFGSENFSVRKRFYLWKTFLLNGLDLWVEVERWSFPWWQQCSLLLQLLLKRLWFQKLNLFIRCQSAN